MLTRRALARWLALPAAFAGQARPQTQTGGAEPTTSIDAAGTAHITRIIPVPASLSPQAKEMFAADREFAPNGWTDESKELVRRAQSVYPVTIEDAVFGGVKVKVVTPRNASAAKRDRVMINLHGGGFTSDSGSLLESIPIAGLSATRVITVDYRLAPKSPFPAAVDDVVAVYREILKQHSPRKVAMFGTSAGAILTAETAVQLGRLRLSLPAALGFFSGHADFARNGDSRSIYSVRGFTGFQHRPTAAIGPYVGDRDPKDPVLSPIYADLSKFPPTLCMTGTRDMLLSGTCDFHRTLLRAGVDAHLMVFDAMPHAHWYTFDLPESREALEAQARFLDKHLA
jgi:acetyl esterase/lipase